MFCLKLNTPAPQKHPPRPLWRLKLERETRWFLWSFASIVKQTNKHGYNNDNNNNNLIIIKIVFILLYSYSSDNIHKADLWRQPTNTLSFSAYWYSLFKQSAKVLNIDS